jgi:hypothetical protein
MPRSVRTSKWYDQPKWAALLALGGFLAAYGMASRALYTGSLQQYFMTLGLLVFGCNRALHLLYIGLKLRKKAA